MIIDCRAYLTGKVKYMKDTVHARGSACPSPVGKVQGKELEHRNIIRGIVHRDAKDLATLSQAFLF